ncbi:unnamed protein product [Commensalibacter communis]|uniref:hypothetical protein n=1 Tax=Commensalibacter communis TaxID=2972786 RepID=UPI0022FF99B2|nr:hypothetical protein [Commensalibacter communis]CAI3954384.1 unnamed protein product [Commensalibacter communis]CAI3958490.1 unnamed protein product [Commensalibacter communis]
MKQDRQKLLFECYCDEIIGGSEYRLADEEALKFIHNFKPETKEHEKLYVQASLCILAYFHDKCGLDTMYRLKVCMKLVSLFPESGEKKVLLSVLQDFKHHLEKA